MQLVELSNKIIIGVLLNNIISAQHPVKHIVKKVSKFLQLIELSNKIIIGVSLNNIISAQHPVELTNKSISCPRNIQMLC